MKIKKIINGNCYNFLDNSERFVQGIFENYPPNCHDNLNKVSGSLEWFQFYDRVTTVVATKNDWQVMPYTNYAFASWHLGFALPRAPKLSFPYTANEVNKNKETKSYNYNFFNNFIF